MNLSGTQERFLCNAFSGRSEDRADGGGAAPDRKGRAIGGAAQVMTCRGMRARGLTRTLRAQDNNCLFSACGYLCEGRQGSICTELRASVAEHVRSSPDVNDVLLGMPVEVISYDRRTRSLICCPTQHAACFFLLQLRLRHVVGVGAAVASSKHLVCAGVLHVDPERNELGRRKRNLLLVREIQRRDPSRHDGRRVLCAHLRTGLIIAARPHLLALHWAALRCTCLWRVSRHLARGKHRQPPILGSTFSPLSFVKSDETQPSRSAP